jgi:uncharacterized cupin superfamily protein
MTDRLLSANVLRELLVPDGSSAVLSTSQATLARLGDVEIGLWEASPGTDTDVEADEVFLVLSGRARVTFADGGSIDLAPGVLVRLHAGDQTTWEVTERLRKLYLC